MAHESLEKIVTVRGNDLIGQILDTTPTRPVYIGLNFDAFGNPFPNFNCDGDVRRYLEFCNQHQVSMNQADLVYCQRPGVFLPMSRNIGLSTTPHMGQEIADHNRESLLTARRYGRISLNLTLPDSMGHSLAKFRADWMGRLTEEDYQVTSGQLWFIAVPTSDPYDKLQRSAIGLNITSSKEHTRLQMDLGIERRRETGELIEWFKQLSPSA